MKLIIKQKRIVAAQKAVVTRQTNVKLAKERNPNRRAALKAWRTRKHNSLDLFLINLQLNATHTSRR